MAAAFEKIANLAVGATALAFGDGGGALHAAGAAVGLVSQAVDAGEMRRVLDRLTAEAAPPPDADSAAVDAVIVKEAGSLMLAPSALRACVSDSRGYETAATDLLLAALGLTVAQGFGPAAIGRAEGLLRKALEAARRNEGYYRTLVLDAVLAAARDAAATRAAVEAAVRDGLAPRALLENLAIRFGHGNPDAPVGELDAYLKEAARDYRAMKKRRDALAASAARLRNVLSAVDAAMAAGDFAAADARLAEAEEIHVAEKLAEPARQCAALRRQRFDAALLAGDAMRALEHLKAAADALAAVDPAEAGQALYEGGIALRRRGLRFGGDGLTAAIAAIAACQTRWTRAADPVSWGRAEIARANALGDQGARTDGAAGAGLLAEAVAAVRAALEVHTHEAYPVNWAIAQNNLGATLRNQGARAHGAESASLLAEAVAAYRAALRVRTREAHPVEWAMTQNNLGTALRDQGARTDGAAGAGLLTDAVAAFRAALEIRTREGHPLDWAMTQNNLGAALRSKGVRTDGAAGAGLLAEAVAAYRAALEVRTREAHPLDWAMTQNNLGNALSNQGTRTDGAAGADLLAEAVAAYSAALEVHTREAYPVEWAMATENAGLALESFGDRGDAPFDHWTAALAAFDAALEVYDPEQMPFNHAKATRIRARIAAKLAALRDGGG